MIYRKKIKNVTLKFNTYNVKYKHCIIPTAKLSLISKIKQNVFKIIQSKEINSLFYSKIMKYQ